MKNALWLSCLISAVSLAGASGRAHAKSAEVLPFIDDDYAAALRKARAQNVPLFVDAWAPWCHSCRSMKAYVFTDAALKPLAGRFVWLAIDTEKPQNAKFVEQFPLDAWPTLFVIDPATEKPALRWLGSATVPELEKLLDDGERAVRGSGAGLEAKLAEADKLYATGHPAESATALQSLLASAPKEWPHRDRAIESLLNALTTGKQAKTCADVAIAQLPTMPRSASMANVAAMGLSCAGDVPDPKWSAPAIASLEASVKSALAPPAIPMAADDVSGLYETLVDTLQAAHDDAGTKQWAQQWASYLEGQAAKAPTAEARAVFDPHRMLAYVALGDPSRAIAMFQQTEKDLPGDYNPYARLAVVMRMLKRYDEALAQSDQALAKVYGPRKGRVLVDRAEIFAEKGDHAAAVKTLQQAKAFIETLPPGQRSQRSLDAINQRLQQLRS